ncbi:uncharacterized protein LOC103996656 [Musa acuminata AAA Group]|nr:PREDICTED: uncharacterized protein LOC103996656 [Musa acuminata subsp. malaccensis]
MIAAFPSFPVVSDGALSILASEAVALCWLILPSFLPSFFCTHPSSGRAMKDWAPSIIATALFAFLCPGVILQLPGKHRPVDFLNMKTSVVAILAHALLFGLLLLLFLVILKAHLYI